MAAVKTGVVFILDGIVLQVPMQSAGFVASNNPRNCAKNQNSTNKLETLFVKTSI